MSYQLPLAISLQEEATLAHFNWGENTLLATQIDDLLQQKGEPFVYIWGPSGAGKSHLLQGICLAHATHDPVVYLPLNILKEYGPSSLDGIACRGLVAIDDIDVVSADPAWEEALFHVYNQIRDNGHTRLIITSQYPPHSPQLKIQLPDLRSRLSAGLVIPLHPPSDDLKVTLLQAKASSRGFILPSAVALFLVTRCDRNMHTLYAFLNQLDEASLAAKRKITIPFVKSVLKL